MRLFVALHLSLEVRERVTSLLNELQRVDRKPRWVSTDALHVTLKFVGNVPDEKLPSLDCALAGVHRPAPIPLEFRGIGYFPNERRPSVLWVGIIAPPELASLAEAIDILLTPYDVLRETRPFRPHLTLARFNDTRLSHALRAQTEPQRDYFFGKQFAHEFHLIESRLKSSGAEYTTLRSYPFASQGIAC